jgi:hypothetical protein
MRALLGSQVSHDSKALKARPILAWAEGPGTDTNSSAGCRPATSLVTTLDVSAIH